MSDWSEIYAVVCDVTSVPITKPSYPCVHTQSIQLNKMLTIFAYDIIYLYVVDEGCLVDELLSK